MAASPSPCRWLILAALLGSTLSTAGTRTASIGVSVTVRASCRVEVPAQVREAGAATHRSDCAGSTTPATRAVIEVAQPEPVQRIVMADVSSPQRWLRYDIEY